jgi:hypothetical protein
MRFYLDTEFNGFGGELMSLALVPADKALPEFYAVVPWRKHTDSWVEKHVVPHLKQAPETHASASVRLGEYMRSMLAPVIVADWPTDLEHLLALLITGPGTMQATPDFTMEFKRLPGFNTADHSSVPHNAIADARALRDCCEEAQRSPEAKPASIGTAIDEVEKALEELRDTKNDLRSRDAVAHFQVVKARLAELEKNAMERKP